MRCPLRLLLLLSVAGCFVRPPVPDLKVQTPYVNRDSVTVPDRGQVERELDVDEKGTVVRATVEAVIQHSQPDELTVTLFAPSGTKVDIDARLEEPSHLYRFAIPLIQLQGEAARGEWRLVVEDRTEDGLYGTLWTWGISFEALDPS